MTLVFTWLFCFNESDNCFQQTETRFIVLRCSSMLNNTVTLSMAKPFLGAYVNISIYANIHSQVCTIKSYLKKLLISFRHCHSSSMLKFLRGKYLPTFFRTNEQLMCTYSMAIVSIHFTECENLFSIFVNFGLVLLDSVITAQFNTWPTFIVYCSLFAMSLSGWRHYYSSVVRFEDLRNTNVTMW